MILTETIHHTHNHGATGWEIYVWVLAAISTMWLLEEAWERWRKWRTEHGSTRTEDAADDSCEACGCQLDGDGGCPWCDTTDDSTCEECGGSGRCRYCDGTGEQGVYSGDTCHPCDGLGICLSCDDADETDKLRAARSEFVASPMTRDEAAARVVERSET